MTNTSFGVPKISLVFGPCLVSGTADGAQPKVASSSITGHTHTHAHTHTHTKSFHCLLSPTPIYTRSISNVNNLCPFLSSPRFESPFPQHPTHRLFRPLVVLSVRYLLTRYILPSPSPLVAKLLLARPGVTRSRQLLWSMADAI